MTTNTQSNVEQYDYGITRSWLSNSTIAYIKTQGDMSRNAVNTWASLLILTAQDWKTKRPIAILHDLSHPNQGLTPYARERTIELLNHIPKDAFVYNAVVLPNTFMNRIIEMFLRTPLFHKDRNEVRVFPTVEMGIAWLQECIAEYENKS